MDAAGFEPVFVRQFTVFMENRVGRLQLLVSALEAAGKIVAMSIAETADAALIRVICARSEPARKALQGDGFSFTESNLLAIELPQRTRHPMVAICAALLSAEISISYAYTFLLPPRRPALALCTDDPILASQILIRKGFTILGESDLSDQSDNASN